MTIMYALIKDGAVQRYPYSVGQLRADNPQISFPADMPAEQLAEFGVHPVEAAEQPAFDAATQRVQEGTPVLHGGKWVQTWAVVALTADEQAAAQLARDNLRQHAYQQEADPLFFKSQRGEATHQQWLDKVAEIKARFPE